MRLIILDTETTGLSPAEGRIVEIAAVEMLDGKLTGREFHHLLNPEHPIFEVADSSTKRNKDEPGDGWLRMPRHHGRSNRQVQVARCTSTSAEKNDTKSTVS